MSVAICSKSAVASAWKTIPATPRELIDSSVSNVTYAVLIANSRSGAGLASLRLPAMMSNRPMRSVPEREGALGRALQLRLEAAEGRDALLERRVRREEVHQRLLRVGREDVEGRQLLGGAQVPLRDPLHRAADSHQRGRQRARAAGDHRGAAVGGELAVARER